MKKNKIKTFIAYRLPFETEIHFKTGYSRALTTLNDCPTEGFLFHSFTGDQIIAVENLMDIGKADFKTTFIPPTDLDQTRADYGNWFKALKKELLNNRFKKVILSRIKTIETHQTSLSLFENLNEAYSNTFNYVISNSEIGTWIGATPETLITTEDTKLSTMSLAGTKTAETDWQPKELEEQQLVTTAILEGLEATNCTQINAVGPETIKAGSVDHLKTTITATMHHSEDWTKVVNELHPTPAVCGIPKKEAQAFIQELETHNRQFYTGFIGVFNAASKRFFVNLRCMQQHAGLAKLYLGGGITAPSDEDAEWLETERKALTLINVLKQDEPLK